MTHDTPPSTTDPDADGGNARRRREAIRQRVIDERFVRIKDLAAAHGVSTMTIHRDLDDLQTTGWLRKVRGGATAEPSASYHGDVRHRRQAMADEKRALAEAAAHLVGVGATVMIDESTTALELARLLPARGPVTVITNFLAAVNALTGESGVDLIALGGAYYPAYDAFLGLRTTEAIRSLRADMLFMSTTAITNGQCYHQSQETVAVKRALMESADRRVLLADHSKFTKNGLFQLAPLTDFDLVVVDAATPEAEVAAQRSRGVRLHVAGTDGMPSWPPSAER
ncbi:DeoR/GlpR family DNA-binding transcription regulator [Actinomadura kijaniata]|uniref:Lactose phosphotransferase system repressor n=1 Tax=Actinomadura namibiensis TaxID=182080 RepID=A0A7W3QQS6_ACTNM|nr:DeoR/GlpR family DNA-binding transcription regulator [Actinomadura namibiensis]MBA8956050.1 DeoR/GlpR family transcriptional regulator of sugar metabolism [Actinomadura namibiensis]